jgi:hypothetical protein
MQRRTSILERKPIVVQQLKIKRPKIIQVSTVITAVRKQVNAVAKVGHIYLHRRSEVEMSPGISINDRNANNTY